LKSDKHGRMSTFSKAHAHAPHASTLHKKIKTHQADPTCPRRDFFLLIVFKVVLVRGHGCVPSTASMLNLPCFLSKAARPTTAKLPSNIHQHAPMLAGTERHRCFELGELRSCTGTSMKVFFTL